MEIEEFCVEFVTNKTYFLEDNMNISFKFKDKSLKIKYSDWIALYKYNSSNNRNLEDFIAVETDLIVRTPAKNGFHHVTFYVNQLKSVKCNENYEFIYGNKFNQICGISHPLRFIHRNDCNICCPNVSETNIIEMNQCGNCVSQDLVKALLSRMSIVDSQLNECKIKSTEIMSMNKRLLEQMNECETFVQKTNEFFDNLFYTDEPVTKDGSNWVRQCSDIDLKMNLIESQERILQDLSSQNACIKKVLENIESKFNENDDHKTTNMDMLNCTVNVESGFIPEPSTATHVFINSDEDDV